MMPHCPWDHPRVCGENNNPLLLFCCSAGSSPRMRGKPYASIRSRCSSRIIPAYAGKTQSRRHDYPCTEDHPRVCGENVKGNLTGEDTTGSSPRMRGKLVPSRVSPSPMGIIPAYAGKTSSTLSVSSAISDHPRVCGWLTVWSQRQPCCVVLTGRQANHRCHGPYDRITRCSPL